MESRAFKCEGERNDHMLHYEQIMFCFVLVMCLRGGIVNGVEH